ncbi:LEAF RUST 10 DISEASE-RESISTANCE LOCUS RECEPTOR-LIKE PROTEIN KINASE-like 2.1 [Prunus yedoensis var. nudiflora]|uniref:LEAF RUST 10 DISEASE-RESISTANCE LOCUS RECEPTOR-LIKE PROTEIN KINASE-like 2.1 n=1 Tax=Prunus yedoensis var. nudiflora TaxID=2094558 RepID=A0A314ULB8_PRUYE|nr:LEAF RUST 10 DISEASE-RESISTANCE LOCUS RECEPTOR-LIKE PROTEIN KINASE-like 2.1 [Prunus yedoensis var. nudiflora]
MSNINYRILKTNSSAPSVTVARQDYWETLCPPTYNNTNINFSLFNYTSGLSNLTFYYGCNLNLSISLDIPGLNSRSQACNGAINVTYVTQSPPFDPVSARICASGVIVPVFTAAAMALEANPTTIQEEVDRGFELGLQIDNIQCNNCAESGGKCGLNTTNGGFSCFCKDQAYATTCNAKVASGFCKEGVNVPVFRTAAVTLEANPTTLQAAVDGGFELALEIDNVQCNSCVESGGNCGLNTTTGGFSCFCLDQAYASVCNATAPGAQDRYLRVWLGSSVKNPCLHTEAEHRNYRFQEKRRKLQ